LSKKKFENHSFAPSQIRHYLDISEISSRLDNSILLSTREKPVSNDWLYSFPEALIAYFQKRMEMQKDSAKSAWLFLVKPLLRSILTE
jgi:hypothetical protein